MRRVRLVVSGLVQGVAYRWSAQREAERLALRGWVRNLPSGQVEALAEGEADAVERFIAWCRRGPPSAEVEKVDVAEHPDGGELAGFQITRYP